MSKLMRAIGLMSGTSLDGIDVALVETDGESIVNRGPGKTYSYDAETRQRLAAAIADARNLRSRADRPLSLKGAETHLTERHAIAVRDFLQETSVNPKSVDIVGFHGQTVLHRPEDKLTVQLGSGALLRDMIGLPVVYDLRAADVAAGGQGAPLVPAYHRALTARLPTRPIAVVNIGGVANITWIGRDGRLIAFDTGPGNALLNDWMMSTTGKPIEQDGDAATRGRPNDEIIQSVCTNAYFSQVPPKSLDRDTFSVKIAEGLSVQDGAATLAALTAQSIAKAREHLPEEPELWIIAGGGRRNKAIMRMLAERVECAVVPAEAVGLDGDSLEAEAWAYLAVRSLKGLPITFPGTTGVSEPLCGGLRAEPHASAT